MTSRTNVALGCLEAADLVHERTTGETIPDGLTVQLVAVSQRPDSILAIIHLKRGPLRARFCLRRDQTTTLAFVIDQDDPKVKDVLGSRPMPAELDPKAVQQLLLELAAGC